MKISFKDPRVIIAALLLVVVISLAAANRRNKVLGPDLVGEDPSRRDWYERKAASFHALADNSFWSGGYVEYQQVCNEIADMDDQTLAGVSNAYKRNFKSTLRNLITEQTVIYPGSRAAKKRALARLSLAGL